MAKKKNKKITGREKKQEFVVMSARIDMYNIFDYRANKPMAYIISHDENGTKGEMVVQELETLQVKTEKGETAIDYFSPNNVGIPAATHWRRCRNIE